MSAPHSFVYRVSAVPAAHGADVIASRRAAITPESPRTFEKQLTEAYWRMAARAHYRPAAPSDGFGGITVPLEDLKTEAEAREWRSPLD